MKETTDKASFNIITLIVAHTQTHTHNTHARTHTHVHTHTNFLYSCHTH